MPVAGDKGELSVVMKAKDLCKYILTVTQKSPKQYRFTFTTRLQNLSMEVIEALYQANSVYVGGKDWEALRQKRLTLQGQAITKTRLLAYIAQLALEQRVILPRQYAQISMLSTEVLNLTYGWIRSDKARIESLSKKSNREEQ